MQRNFCQIVSQDNSFQVLIEHIYAIIIFPENTYTHMIKKNLQLMKIISSKPQQRQQAMMATCCSYFKVAVYMKLSILNTGM